MSDPPLMSILATIPSSTYKKASGGFAFPVEGNILAEAMATIAIFTSSKLKLAIAAASTVRTWKASTLKPIAN
jgi:hypothetical protein